MFVLTLVALLASATLPVRAVDFGQADRGVFVWIGGHELAQPIRFLADSTQRQVFVVDAEGQQYPLFVTPPRPSLSSADSLRAEQQAPGLLNRVAQAKRTAVLNRLMTLNDELSRAGVEPNSIAERILTELRRSPEIDSSGVDGKSVWYYWHGWRLKSFFTAGPSLPTIPVSFQLQQFATSLQTQLQAGRMIILGWNGQYTIIPAERINRCREEISQLRIGQHVERGILTNPQVVGPIQLNRSTQDWLNQAKEK